MRERLSNEGARPIVELSEAEEDMIRTIREWGGGDDYQLLIEHRDGAWGIALSMSPPECGAAWRAGTGATFDQAWDNVNLTWA